MFEKDLFGEDVQPEKHGAILSESWVYPPFSVLNAREGWWQERKRQWLALGIKSELGRGGGADNGKPTSDGTGPELLQKQKDLNGLGAVAAWRCRVDEYRNG